MRNLGMLILATIVGCTPPPAPDELQAVALVQSEAPPLLVREARGALAGGADLYAPARTKWSDKGVWVLDTGSDRLVLFDSTLAKATVFGREGEGPGEIRFAMDMTLAGDRIAIAEIGNGRISIFDHTGVFERTIPSSSPPKYVVASGGELFTAPGAEGYYTDRIDGRPHGAIPEAVARLTRADPRTYLPADAFPASDPSGPIYVLDASVLAVASYDRVGRLLEARLLPEPFRTRLLERRQREMEAWGGRAASFVSVPATKQISIDNRGRLLVPFALSDHWGLLIDPEDWTARPLRLPHQEPTRGILLSASDVNLWGSHLYVLSQDRLFQFDAGSWR